MTKNERLQALKCLLNVVTEKMPLSLENESSFTKALCFGVCRHYYRLQLLADDLLKKRPKDVDVWLILLMGLYQIQFLNKPDYTTVTETVELANKRHKIWAKGLINGVLRTFCRERLAIMSRLGKKPDFVSGHPAWLTAQIKTDWPLEWESILTANDKHPPMSLRVNLQRHSRSDYLERLQEAGLAASIHEHASAGIVLHQPCDVDQLPGFANGDVSVQDIAAQFAASLLDLKPGLRVLDVCAAPGGKTCHLLETEAVECVALDIDKKRLQRVQDNLQRLQLRAAVVHGDALIPEQWWNGELFDRILLDAPCSATGVIRRHPDIKLIRSEEEVAAIVVLQAQILESIWSLLKKGGILLYATCSILKCENEEQIARFIAAEKECERVPLSFNGGKDTGYGWQILPGQNQCDGFFYSVLRKKTDDGQS